MIINKNNIDPNLVILKVLEFENNKIMVKEKLFTKYEYVNNLIRLEIITTDEHNVQENIDYIIKTKIEEIENNTHYLKLKEIFNNLGFISKFLIKKNKTNLFLKNKRLSIESLLNLIKDYEDKINLYKKIDLSNIEYKKLPETFEVENYETNSYYVLKLSNDTELFKNRLKIEIKNNLPFKIKEKEDRYIAEMAIEEYMGSEYTDLIREDSLLENGDVIGSNKKVFKNKEGLHKFLKEWKIEFDERFEFMIKSIY